MSMPVESPAAFRLSCNSLSEGPLHSLSIEIGECGPIGRHRLCCASCRQILMEITRGDFSRQLFRISSAARNAPFVLPRVNQNRWEQAVIAACKGRIAAVDCIGILQCTKPYVHDTKPQDCRVFEIIPAAGLVMWCFALIYTAGVHSTPIEAKFNHDCGTLCDGRVRLQCRG